MKILNKILPIAYDNLDVPQARQRHFSFIVRGNQVLCWGCNNNRRTHPLAAKYSEHPYIHSELAAILAAPVAPAYFCRCDLINLRVMRNGRLGLARPCSHCRRLLEDFEFRRVYYSTNKGEIIEL